MPTVAEGGVPGYEAVSWFGLFGPPGMPADVVAKINAEVRRIFADPGTAQDPGPRILHADRGVAGGTDGAHPRRRAQMAQGDPGRRPAAAVIPNEVGTGEHDHQRPGCELGAFFNPTGHHVAWWRHLARRPMPASTFNIMSTSHAPRRAECDMVYDDNVCVREANMEALSRPAQYIANFEPLTLLSALAPMTSHIGLVATASTSYNEPFHVARKFASIDHISGGRAGWNLVTSGRGGGEESAARGCQHGERYERARESHRSSWGCGFMGRRHLRARQGNWTVLHRTSCTRSTKGREFLRPRPAEWPRAAQGRPVIVHGRSEDIIAVAAEFAEAIFCHLIRIAEILRGAEVASPAMAATRSRSRYAGLSCIVGRTKAEAQERHQYCNR